MIPHTKQLLCIKPRTGALQSTQRLTMVFGWPKIPVISSQRLCFWQKATHCVILQMKSPKPCTFHLRIQATPINGHSMMGSWIDWYNNIFKYDVIKKRNKDPHCAKKSQTVFCKKKKKNSVGHFYVCPLVANDHKIIPNLSSLHLFLLVLYRL